MRLFVFACLILAVAVTPFHQASADAADHDFHPMTDKEKNIFYPLVCLDPIEPTDGQNHMERSCGKIAGLPYATSLLGDDPRD